MSLSVRISSKGPWRSVIGVAQVHHIGQWYSLCTWAPVRYALLVYLEQASNI